MTDRIDVMISSTARDLPEHRKEVMEAILRLGMHPAAMEHLPAKSEDAIDTSLKMVDGAEIYVGIFAHRYGYIPDSPKNPDRLSITELELQRAVERDIPRLIFIIGEDHPIESKMLETDPEGASKVLVLRERLTKSYVVKFFNSPQELREQVITSLAAHFKSEPVKALHSDLAIPPLPEPYIAHAYSLLQTSGLVGRQAELNLLTDWIAKPGSLPYHARVFSVVAIGGMGKSALTWKWFNDVAPNEKAFAGRLWWSFYESNAHFENFVIRALAYVSGRTREDIEKNTKPGEREDLLLGILDREQHLLVLDGLERILIAYARMDAAHLADSDYDRQTANVVAGAHGLPESAGQSFVGEVGLRKCADPRAGQFLRKLATVRRSRILISTRLYPAELQAITGYPMPGCFAMFLPGLSDDDALTLWRAFGVSGARDELLPVFRQIDSHPLLIQALAGEIARFRGGPGDFATWRAANTTFDPFQHRTLAERQAHVLDYALRELDPDARQLLSTLAAFRGPAGYETLAAVTVAHPDSEGIEMATDDAHSKDGGVQGTIWAMVRAIRGGDNRDVDVWATRRVAHTDEDRPKPIFASHHALDDALTTLEDRGLVGWDRRANRYDLHPIVRGLVWNGVRADAKRDIYGALETHFSAMPTVDFDDVESLDDLTPAIELYNALIGQGRYDEAGRLFYDRIGYATLYRLSAARQHVELLERLFPDGLDQLPRLHEPAGQAYTLNALAQGCKNSGQPGRAAPLFARSNDVDELRGDMEGVSVGLGNLSDTLRQSGVIYDAEHSARRALILTREGEERFDEAISLYWLGLVLAARGDGEGAHHDVPLQTALALAALRRSTHIFRARTDQQGEGVISSYLAQRALWRGDYAAAHYLADRAWDLAYVQRYERDFIAAACRQGQAALGLGDFVVADERLHHALTRARVVNLVEEELPALTALAELRRRQGKPDEALELLDQVWEGAGRGPYPLYHADALNVLAQIERDAGHTDAAVEAAMRAYTLAWCDGISADGTQCYAYWWGLKAAKAHLDALGAPVPDLPPFTMDGREPMPQVEIDPDDEFHVGDRAVEDEDWDDES